ncbi:MAG: DNA methyltransferase [Candidatus Bathyarchaeia archaeon]
MPLNATIERINVSFKNNWNKPVHRWYRFHAGCSSDFPEKIISLLKIEQGKTIMDPFTGSGTILVSAKERGVNSIGIDINPFYVFMAKVKTYWEFDMKYLFGNLKIFTEQIRLLSKKINPCGEKSSQTVSNIPKYIWRYFNSDVLKILSTLKEAVLEFEDENIKDFLLFALASILIDVSKVHYVGETIVFNKNTKTNNAQVYDIYINKIWEMYSDLEAKQHLRNKGTVEIRKADARNLKNLVPDESIDHVITHPPYLNNYNYLLRDRLPLFFLEYFKTLSDEKKMRELIVGSVTNNKAFAEPALNIQEFYEIVERVKNTGDVERYYAVLKYFHFMDLFLTDLHNKLKRNGYCAMLVGNSYIRGVMIPLDVIIAKLAEKSGFKVFANSMVRDRGNGAFQHLYNGRLYENILILKRP